MIAYVGSHVLLLLLSLARDDVITGIDACESALPEFSVVGSFVKCVKSHRSTNFVATL